MRLKILLRLVIMMFLPYFGMDLVTPEIAGAFNFAWDLSIEVIPGPRTSVAPAAALPSRPEVESGDAQLSSQSVLLRVASPAVRRDWLTPVRGARPSLSHDAAAPVEAD